MKYLGNINFIIKAKNSSPCVIFFDEIDALSYNRKSSDTSVTSNRILNQLLCELDGNLKIIFN